MLHFLSPQRRCQNRFYRIPGNRLHKRFFSLSIGLPFDIGKRPSEETYRLRATRRTVATLQAEVYLWRNKYNKAVTACNNYSASGGGAPGGTWFNQFWGISNFNLFNGEMFFVPFDYLGRQVNPFMQFVSSPYFRTTPN